MKKPSVTNFQYGLKSIVWLFAMCVSAAAISHADHKAEDEVSKVLDSLHQYAAEANGEAYFSLYQANAVFIGTDVGERWSLEQFKSYSMPIFNKGKGWTYHKRERNVFISDDGNTAWFDEVLDSENYGTSRGTGVLVKTANGWKFSQYHLTFPIPNDLAKGFTEQIMAFEAEQSKASAK